MKTGVDEIVCSEEEVLSQHHIRNGALTAAGSGSVCMLREGLQQDRHSLLTDERERYTTPSSFQLKRFFLLSG